MVLAALLLAIASEDVVLPALDPTAPAVSIAVSQTPLPTPKHSPSQKAAYAYQTTGLVSLGGPIPRFRVFSQTLETHQSLSPKVARMLLRLWQLSFAHYGRDHAQRYNRQLVDVYLCETGEPGGEQLFGLDPDSRKDVNAIFIYDLKSFNVPLEMAREVAHEYGHATLPPVGGYKEGEGWINGDMGEMIYLRGLRDQMRSGQLVPEDTMGANLADLDSWVSHEVDPVEADAATKTPGADMAKRTMAGRAAFLGLAAYAQSILPVSVWRRSLILFGSTHAEDYPDAIVEAVNESTEDVNLTIPVHLRQNSIWIPFKGKTAPKVRTLAKKPGWLKIAPAGAAEVRLGSTFKPEEPAKFGR